MSKGYTVLEHYEDRRFEGGKVREYIKDQYFPRNFRIKYLAFSENQTLDIEKDMSILLGLEK